MRREEPGNGAGEHGLVAVAHRLEHLDRNDLVEAPGHVPEVAELHVDPVREAGGRDSAPGEFVLGGREGDRRDVATAGASGVQRPAPPAGADFQHPISGLQA